MALLTSELARLKYELGFSLVDVGAEPYIGISVLFEQVIQPHILGGASTTSTTPVTAATTPTGVTLTLASATGFAAFARVIVDVDDAQEAATVQAVSGSTISVRLRKAHSGTYPVTVEGPESIIRALLQKLQAIDGLGDADAGAVAEALASAGIKKVDEVEFFGGGTTGMYSGQSSLATVSAHREMWRDQLAAVLGIERLNGRSRSGGGSVSVY